MARAIILLLFFSHLSFADNTTQITFKGAGSSITTKQVGSGTDWSKVSCGRYNTIAIKTDGTLWQWGDNEKGSLGQNNLTQYSSPVQVPGTSWEKCYISYPSYAIKTDGTLWVWGYNYRGSFGTNTDTDANTSSPVQIGSGTGWLEITGTSFIVYATKYL